MNITSKNALDQAIEPEELGGIVDQLALLTEAGLRDQVASMVDSPRQTVIDWNFIQPDGSPESLHVLLTSIGQLYQANVFLGHLSRAGHAKDIECSDHAWQSLKRKPIWLRNVVVEAAHSRRIVGSTQAFGTLTAVMVQANRELASGAVMGIGVPLDVGQPKFGCVLAFKETLSLEQAEKLAVAGERLADELRPWLRCWHHNYLAKNWITRVLSVTSLMRARPKQIALALAISAIVLSIPLPYWPKRACVLEPTIRQFISSPMDGRVLTSMVKPGENVSKDQVLAKLDDGELTWSLASAQAEYEATAKKRDIGLAHTRQATCELHNWNSSRLLCVSNRSKPTLNA